MEKTLGKKVKDAFNIFTYLLILLLTLYIGIALLFPRQYKQLNHYQGYVVVSDSMEPKIPVMSMIIVDRVSIDDLKLDDIISFNFDIDHDGVPDTITHRVAEIAHDDLGIRTFRTKPENSGFWDNWVLHDKDIIGRVVLIIPYLGYVAMFMNQYALPILLLLNILIWIMMYRIIRNWKKG